MDEREFLDELRSELVAAAHRRQDEPTQPRRSRGRRLVLLGAAAAVLVAVLVGVMTLRTTSPASADVDVIISGNDVIVRLTDLRTRPHDVVAAAKEVGLNLRIKEVPVGPSNVGRFIGDTTSIPPHLTPLDPNGTTFTGFRIPRDWPGTLEIRMGREARDGEKWAAASDALAPGEPAACEPLLGKDVATVRDRLRDDGLDVRWFMMPSPGEVTSLRDYRSWKVVKIDATSDHDVFVQATRDGSWPFVGERPRLPEDC